MDDCFLGMVEGWLFRISKDPWGVNGGTPYWWKFNRPLPIPYLYEGQLIVYNVASPRYLEHALAEIGQEEDIGVYGPDQFVPFIERRGFPKPSNTASVLSLDTLTSVPSYLRDQNAMVFRMGKGQSGNWTNFVLAKVPDGPDSFFLKDEEIFENENVVVEADPLSDEKFLGYRLVSKLQEMALVNLAMGSGQLGRCLGLDEKIVHAPAMLSSRYSFRLHLHPDIDQVFEHRAGQVQIDSLFTARRNGELQLFVLEAKFVRKNASLAKHKLVYPCAAMYNNPEVKIPIVPVYLSVMATPEKYIYRIAECQLPLDRDLPVLSEFGPRKTTKAVVKRYDTD